MEGLGVEARECQMGFCSILDTEFLSVQRFLAWLSNRHTYENVVPEVRVLSWSFVLISIPLLGWPSCATP